MKGYTYFKDKRAIIKPAFETVRNTSAEVMSYGRYSNIFGVNRNASLIVGRMS